MDDKPQNTVPPRTHLRQLSPRPAPRSQASGSPVGFAVGCLLAGAWSIVFVRWFSLSGWLFWLVAALAFFLVGLGLLIFGASLPDLLRKRHL